MKHFTIAIDGPGGAGKSTVAGNIAKRLNVLHLDTGAMYRAFALRALAEGVQVADDAAVAALAARVRIEVRFRDGRQHTWVEGEDVTDRIRTPEISKAASDFAVLMPVRRLMVRLQQAMAASQSMVLDGRDTGTRVLPDATLKVYLTAASEVRAQRRCEELRAQGVPADYPTVLNDVIARDLQDTNRAIDPLTAAPDAVTVHTDTLTQAQVEQTILDLLEKKLMQTEKGSPKTPPRERFTFFYRVAMAVSRLVFHTLVPVRYHGLENLSVDAPYILIGNHLSMIDPFLIGWKVRRYQIRYLGKKELTRSAVMRAIYKNLLMIPVERHNTDMQAVRVCLKTLKENHVLGIFPEGTRYKKTSMQELESGVAMIALRGGVPILPAYIASKPKLFRRMHCYYGAPFTVDEWAKGNVNREAVEAVLAKISEVYRSMAQAHDASRV